MHRKPATQPMTNAAQGKRYAAPAVTPTRPASMPLQQLERSYTLVTIRSRSTAESPPPAAASVVHIAERAIIVPLPSPTMPIVEPELNPYHPIQRMNVPNTTSGAELPGIGTTSPFASNRPMRGPIKNVPQNAAMPPVM
eukprot:scaffold57795_cov31-Tisochrysis_lutea.AAC.2